MVPVQGATLTCDMAINHQLQWPVAELRVQIVRFVDEHQPGFVECEFTDATGQRHTVIDKVPVVSPECLDARSHYPRTGAVRCEVLETRESSEGVKLTRISTRTPDGKR